jgi:lipopolysaccharide biosynthesis protein
MDGAQHTPAPRAIAFYLPQFHPIPENDRWWGPGFTEWRNVTRAKPLFAGHDQPRVPADLGYYDLGLDTVRAQQIELARTYGIHGFCYYTYWFGGKKLLDMPLGRFVADKSLDFPFCLCFANDNWTRRWDGREQEILIAQQHSPEDDRAFLRDILPLLQDPRYIRVGNRPLLLIYRAEMLPDPEATAARWREEAARVGLELYLAKCESFGHAGDPRPLGFDANVEFPPANADISPVREKPAVFEYLDLMRWALGRPDPDFPLMRGITLAWDNSARRGRDAFVFHNFKHEYYERWLLDICRWTVDRRPPDERFVFINAWNEWAEGTYLEPDVRHGHESLRATRRALEAADDYASIRTWLQDRNEAGRLLAFLEQRERVERCLVDSIARVDQQSRELRQEINRLRQSWSWKLTRPLRWAIDRLRGRQ